MSKHAGFFRGRGGEGVGSGVEGKSWDHRQLAHGTRTGWAASISHSVSPVRMVGVRERVPVSTCVVLFFLFFFFFVREIKSDPGELC